MSRFTIGTKQSARKCFLIGFLVKLYVIMRALRDYPKFVKVLDAGGYKIMNALQDTSIMRVVKTLVKTKVSILAIDKLEQLANKVGVDEKELFELYVQTKNRVQLEKFASTPYNERILLLPRCMRATHCPAEIGKNGYECMQCGKCAGTEITNPPDGLVTKELLCFPEEVWQNQP